MAAPRVPNPYDSLDEQMPRTGPPVQNLNGMARNTAPPAPIQPPAVRATPGPAPMIKAGAPAPGTIPAPPEPIRIGAPTAPSAPAAPAPAPDLYGKGGGGGLEDQIRQAMTGMFSGSTSRGFIDRARQALGTATEARRNQAVKQIDEDAIRRGLFRSGIPSEQAAAAGTAAQGSFAAGLADILNNAEQQDIQGRQFATQSGLNLLGMNRDWDRYSQERADAMAARGGGGGGDPMVTIIDPDTGQAYELPQSYLDF